MGNRGRTPPFSGAGQMPLTPTVRILLIANVAIWLLLQVILEQYVLSDSTFITKTFGLVPISIIERIYLWQPLTYMFLHSLSPMHIIFNMLLLWWVGSELELHWGRRFFTAYYFICGIGAAIIYVFGVTSYSLLTNQVQPLLSPVVGASGALFGLMLAYGILFGDRVVYFMFVFPMKARIFIMIIGGLEVVMLLNHGVSGSSVANLAHIGGILSGFLFLTFWSQWKKRKQRRLFRRGGGRQLELVVNKNSKENKNPGPTYWH